MKENIRYVNPNKEKFFTKKRVIRMAISSTLIGVFIGTGMLDVVIDCAEDAYYKQTPIEQSVDLNSLNTNNVNNVQTVHPHGR